MNCDQAFERLTDPAHADDVLLARHLDRCPRCREMQATLAPALAWLSDTAQCDLPEVFPVEQDGRRRAPLLTLQAVELAEMAATALHRKSRVNWWLAASRAVVIAGVALVGVSVGRNLSGDLPPTSGLGLVPDSGSTLTACLWDHPAERSHLADPSPRAVVASCVLCHVPTTVQ
jgi:predicted anti-sigma-YlaC factor YlaD